MSNDTKPTASTRVEKIEDPTHPNDPWAVWCTDHGTVARTRTRKLARELETPDFCPDCRPEPIEVSSGGFDATDEKGNVYSSATTGERVECEWCGDLIEVRRAGRRPRFCSPAHRVASHRAHEALERATQAARTAQREADARVEAARLRLTLRNTPARYETTGDPDSGDQPAWTYVPGSGWVDTDQLS